MRAPTNTSATLTLRVDAIRYVARDILAFELRAPGGAKLAPAEPGAHIAIALPNGLTRQYSLVHAGSAQARDVYEVAVKRDPRSRGGSTYMHDTLRVGSLLAVEPPCNNFPLIEDAPLSVFFAGGIGITPIVSMLERLRDLNRPRVLHYACSTREDLAYVPAISNVIDPKLHVDADAGGQLLNIAAIVASLPRTSHLYCCGPAPMLATFETVTQNWPREQIHTEYFTAREEAARDGGYTIALARSGREFQVPPGKTILQVLRDAGLSPASSCEEGVCAACETRVLEGVPDHRDAILTPAERASNRVMMICCSGSKTPRLVLDV